MDHRMPEMDGMEAVRLIRALGTEYAANLPIIALTASDEIGYAEKFMESGFNGFIGKPIDLRQLNMEVSRCVSGVVSDLSPISVADGDGVNPAGIDWQEGRRRYGQISFQNILHSFLRHTPDVLSRMESMLPEHMPDYAVAMHGLKGSCYGVCAVRFGQMAAAMEKKAIEGYSPQLQAEHKAFVTELRELLDSLKDMFEQRQTLERRTALSRETLRFMLDSSRHYRMNKMEEALDELEHYVYEDEAANELVVWLREQTDNLAYGAIVQKLTAYLQNDEHVVSEKGFAQRFPPGRELINW
jgi:CheY-like chemotaxis protein